MELDLNILNIKPKIAKIDINGKVTFPKEDLEKAKILDLKEISVNGNLNSDFKLELNIKGTMILPCSLTLETVDYPFDITINENIDEFIENSKKTQKTIDILPIIWENILMEIPMKVVSPNAKNMKTKGEGWELITDSEEKGISSLAKLKDLL